MKKNNEVEYESAEKPSDWPQNRRESVLELIDQLCDDFIKNPTYVNKERLIVLATFDDPNHNYNFGKVRFSDYECGLINELYLKFKMLNFQYGINFIYDILHHCAHHIKMVNMIPGPKPIAIEDCYRGLQPFLKYFFWASYNYFVDKQRTFADELINTIDLIGAANILSKERLAFDFNTVIYDLSCKCTNHWFYDFDFSRQDIKKLIEKSSDLMSKASLKQCDRPHKGVLCMMIANYVLRSRNNYDFNNIYKCVDKVTVDSSFTNNELWMRRRSKLNDKRESKVIREVFANRKWIAYEWAKNVKFTFERESFTCSFSKTAPDDLMKNRYGKYVYGFHNDVVGPSITTLIKVGEDKAKFSQFIVYDVLYSREEFREEMNYLFSLIDSFLLTDDEKKYFLEEIIDYWKLTVKDKRWSYENERRYEIMHFKNYNYVECSINDEFLKNKTPLLLYPDFIVGENHMMGLLRLNAIEKTRFQSLGSSMAMCRKCLYRTFSFDKEGGCEICGSKEYDVISERA